MDGTVLKIRFRTRALILIASSAAILLFYASIIDLSIQQVMNADHLHRTLPPFPKGSITNESTHTISKCQPRSNIMFLKTHKCASSTIQNILMRYGNTKNLTFVLPPHGNYLGHPIKFSSRNAIALPSSYSKAYNIFCHHTRWEEKETARIMPKDTVYISILKEPAAMYESLYNWVNLDQRYGVSLEKFLANPAKYYRNTTEKNFARNPMSFDFGLEMDEFENQTAIKSKIAEIDRRFSLVLMAEFMDESLVLLRDLLCWRWEDVVVFRINARKHEFKRVLSSDLKENIRLWNSADAELYEFFKEKFRNQIESYGKAKMREDVNTLRKISGAWYEYCVKSQISRNETSDVRFQVWHYSVSGFQLTPAGMKNPLCIQLAMAENPFTDYLRIKLWPKFRPVTSADKKTDLWEPGFW